MKAESYFYLDGKAYLMKTLTVYKVYATYDENGVEGTRVVNIAACGDPGTSPGTVIANRVAQTPHIKHFTIKNVGTIEVIEEE